MSRLLTVFFLFVLAATLAIGLQSQVVAQTRGASPAPGTSLGCGCPKGNVCCLNCDGSTFCARSYAYCPECAAP
jgi:hypothetical protein